MTDDKRELLEDVYRKIESLEPLGGGAVFRRSLSIVADALNEVTVAQVRPRCREPRDGHRELAVPAGESVDRPLSFSASYLEFRAEDRRRTVHIDPVESYATQLIDFYSGRVDTFEVRVAPGLAKVAEEADAIARETMVNHHQFVETYDVAAPDRLSLVDTLNSLAAYLSSSELSTLEEDSDEMPEISALARGERCWKISTQAAGTRWRENGTVLEQKVRDVFRCVDADSCCENRTWTKHGAWRWTTIWRDTGDAGNRPPATPPPFERHPWDNACEVFPSIVVGEVSSDWGWRNIGGNLDFHPGIDIAVPVGTQVLNVAAGEVVWINRTASGGQTGVIVRTGGEIRQYWHIDPDAGISIGDDIAAGTPVGVTANISSPHLHFARFRPPNGQWELKNDRNSINPCP